MKKLLFTLGLSFALALPAAQAQVAIGTTTPEASAILQLESTSKGFLPPRLTSAERDAIPSPVEGLLIYNTTDKRLEFSDGSNWFNLYDGSSIIAVASGTPSGTGKAGIGTNSPNPNAALELQSTAKGFLPPRLTTSQRDAIPSPIAGLLIYNTSNKRLELCDGTSWVDLLTGNIIIARNSASSSGSGLVGVGTSTPDPSVALQLESTTQGFLPTRMTIAQRDAIASPAEGLTFYNTENNCLEFFNNADWVSACDGSIVTTSAPSFPAGTVHCDPNNITAVVDVVNPTTGKTWMDRNLGATQVATSSADANSFGDLYQWGRAADGHQCRNSSKIYGASSSDQPGHGYFIIVDASEEYNWRFPRNTNLWQGVNGTNNPCPSGYRVPTLSEWEQERLSWTSNDAAGAFASPLKLPEAGYRDNIWVGSVLYKFYGYYWTSTFCTVSICGTSQRAVVLFFSWNNSNVQSRTAASGSSVRCIKN